MAYVTFRALVIAIISANNRLGTSYKMYAKVKKKKKPENIFKIFFFLRLSVSIYLSRYVYMFTSCLVTKIQLLMLTTGLDGHV